MNGASWTSESQGQERHEMRASEDGIPIRRDRTERRELTTVLYCTRTRTSFSYEPSIFQKCFSRNCLEQKK